jgi:flagellar biosynthesis protein FlhA
VLLITGAVVLALSIIPGFPFLALLVIGGALVFLALRLRKKKKTVEEQAPELPVSETEFYKNMDNVYTLLNVEPIVVEVGYSLIPIVDESKGGNFINRVVMLRRKFAEEFGIVIPSVTLRDNSELNVNEYVIKLKDAEVARGEVLADHYLAMNPIEGAEEIEGIDTIEPAFKLPAKWISAENRENAQMSGYTVIDPLSVIITHLSEVINKHMHEMLGRKELHSLLENLKNTNKELIEDTIPSVISKGELQKILCNLLSEGIPIRDLETIIETAAEYAPTIKDVDILTEYVRQALKRTITRKYARDGHLKVLTLNPDTENLIMDLFHRT